MSLNAVRSLLKLSRVAMTDPYLAAGNSAAFGEINPLDLTIEDQKYFNLKGIGPERF